MAQVGSRHPHSACRPARPVSDDVRVPAVRGAFDQVSALGTLTLVAGAACLVVALVRFAQWPRGGAAQESDPAFVPGRRVAPPAVDPARDPVAIPDGTGRHDAQQAQLEAALVEKTVLLDEVHHRVKNNLQVIISLLALQARTASPEARAALADTRHRVHAMALTHQLLHEHGDRGRLHAGLYIARLARMLAEGHRADAPGVRLQVDGTDAPLRLTLSQAIPCGLLVNELVTNAYRHAFPDGRSGTIRIALACDAREARITIEDDGIGMPGGIDPPSRAALGFQLVPLLVEQLGARLRCASGPGTRFELVLPQPGDITR